MRDHIAPDNLTEITCALSLSQWIVLELRWAPEKFLALAPSKEECRRCCDEDSNLQYNNIGLCIIPLLTVVISSPAVGSGVMTGVGSGVIAGVGSSYRGMSKAEMR